MKATEFILSNLEKFVMNFPKTRVRYEYDILAKIHFVEVVPNEVYHLDDNYIRWESNLFDEFIDLFPEENICFISDDSTVGIELANSVFYGKEYTSISTKQDSIKINPVHVNLLDSILDKVSQISFSTNTSLKQPMDSLFPGDNQPICITDDYPLAA
ncbi:MAG: hypothetical protein GXY94_09250 [Bacteroidales bacterium]|jgi:hypothetical protein|nr:hypothetical protein [Bacteroidales bacterium]